MLTTKPTRVFLSDHDSDQRHYHETHHTDTRSWYLGAYTPETVAYDEATRILAETEAMTYYPGHEGKAHLAYTVLTNDHDGYRVAFDCLAEALAAFCEEGQ